MSTEQQDHSAPLLPRLGQVERRASLPAPPSGQQVRLRHGQSPSEGYLQFFTENKAGKMKIKFNLF